MVNPVRYFYQGYQHIALDRCFFLHGNSVFEIFWAVDIDIVRAPDKNVDVYSGIDNFICQSVLVLFWKGVCVACNLDRIATQIMRLYADFQLSFCALVYRY